MRNINSDKVFDIVNYTLLVLIMLILLYPLYFVLIASFSEPVDVVSGKVLFWIESFSLDSYKEVFKEKSIWRGYRVAIVNTLCGTCLSLAMTIPAAYAMSKKRMKLHGILTIYFVFTMYFGGGLLPSYLNIRDMNLLNKPYTLIVIGGFGVYNMIITRTYFSNSIPESLFEAAEIDGASDFQQFFKIALPLAKPVIAVITLYYAVGRWNNWFSAMIYVNNEEYYPLQTVLRNILIEGTMHLTSLTENTAELSAEELTYFMQRAYLAESMKYSIIFVGSLPMLIIYPFVQKYFVKGVMVGSIKG